jgi:ribosomal protein S27E
MPDKMEPSPPRAAVKLVCQTCGRIHLVYPHPQTYLCPCGERLTLPPPETPQTGTKEEDQNG